MLTTYIDPRYQLPPHAKSRAQRGEFDRLLPDGSVLSLRPALFHGGLLGVSAEMAKWESWDYLDYWHAFAQFAVWEGSGEPDGWSRHMDTGRYRIDGIPELEYVKDESDRTIEYCVEYAVRVTQGRDRRILKIDEEIPHAVQLDGMRLFFVESEHTIRDGDICFHIDHVYHYGDRSVVLSLDNLANGMQRTVITRLTGQNSSER
jgi:hypothetical protein